MEFSPKNLQRFFLVKIMSTVWPTRTKLKSLMSYSKTTGLFTRVINSGGRSKGSIAGTKSDQGYIMICIDGKKCRAHILAFLYVEGYVPENIIDHKDRVRDNNKWKNLRETSRSCNMKNATLRSDNKCGITGVCYRPRDCVFAAQVSNRTRISLGTFPTLIEAAKARHEAEVKYGYKTCRTTSTALKYILSNDPSYFS